MQVHEATVGQVVITPRGRMAKIVHAYSTATGDRHAWVKDLDTGLKGLYAVDRLAIGPGREAVKRSEMPPDDLIVATRRFETARDQWGRASERWAAAALQGRPDPEGMSVDALWTDVRSTKANTDQLRTAMRAAMADAGVAYRTSGQPE